MKLNFLIAPDFSPEHYGGWFLLSAWLQKAAQVDIHLLTPTNAREQAELIDKGEADIVYANPFDASAMIRQQGYKAFGRPRDKFNEIVIATSAVGSIECLDDLRPGCRIAAKPHQDARLIGLRLLESANLAEQEVVWHETENFQSAARLAIRGDVEAALLPRDTYFGLSQMTRSQLRPLIESAIHEISHVLVANAKAIPYVEALTAALLALTNDSKGQSVLEGLGLPAGFQRMSDDEAESMIDLMDTLLD